MITPTVLPADGQSVANVRARVTDAFGNMLAGQVVHFSTSLGSVTASGQTDAAGVTVAPLTAPPTTGVAQVAASVGVLQSTTNVTFAQAGRNLYLPGIRR